MNYIALLRGINVGGNKKVPMEELRNAFGKLSFSSVKTLLNSGNVLFTSEETDIHDLQKKIEEHLEKTFGWKIDTFVYPQEKLQQLIAAEPFQGVVVTPETRLYVTFIGSDAKESNLRIPYTSQDGNFSIRMMKDSILFSVLTLTKDGDTLKLMDLIGKEFGKNVTTRNWNTVKKLAAVH